MVSKELSGEANTLFGVVVKTADSFGFTGPEVVVSAVTDEGDPTVFGRFEALDRIDDEWWVIRGVLVDTEFGPIVRSVLVQPWPLTAEREVTYSVLKQIRPTDLRDRAFVQLRFGAATLSGRAPTAEETARIEAADKAPRRGRKPRPDSHYRRVAQSYLRLFQEQGQSRGLIGDLADEWGVLPETMRGWVHRARAKGWLTKGRRGRPGAAPGPKFLAWLNQNDHEKEEEHA